MKIKTFIYYNLLIFLIAVSIRLLFAPGINIESDSFAVLLSAQNIYENGNYIVPPIALSDFNHYQQFTGWGVGYSLILSVVFSIFGYGEVVARWFTIIVCSLIVPLVAILGSRFYNNKVGIVSALLVAINPLMVCFNGRILTANMGLVFLTYSISFALLATIDGNQGSYFLSFRGIVASRGRIILLCLSLFLYGCTLCTRDDYLMFSPVLVYIFSSVVYRTHKHHEYIGLINYAKCIVIGLLCLFIGFLPNIYYNYKNYGKVFTSSHREYGASLSLEYLLRGSKAALGLPGWLVIVFTVVIFAFPIISILILRVKTKYGNILSSIIILLLVPIILVCGSFFVSSTGASPRYIIPLVPFVMISAAMVVVMSGIISQTYRFVFIAALILWHVIMYYPPTSLFNSFPKIAYLTQYSPWYNTHNYLNYPHPVSATLKWVNINLPDSAIILSDYDSYHYYFYAKRDVISRDDLNEIKKYIGLRPIFLVEDHRMLTDPPLLKEWRKKLVDNAMDLTERGSIPFFSPSKGSEQLRIYELIQVPGKMGL